ncbi:hypothetical protein E6P09_16040 (plasmid) [Haloferax mediterranei ATCC 33500]|uniref:Uncharacterized protein n=1 Tax=Haloferax mediterranei (strain ATCC 33500 / DSM 1411 / JCM 8866 / NBRC 14739 / NCIMB 2177 / R-4) TaxID=523841 RepID=M0IKB3_HALMT|nr:hypothetical protein [Haloferax mediterranei]AHZ24441.1 hypothetical protein BM92_16120 [Haloferax mediterranei ATCC 33500]ELZ97185.1 hypothetical protein C439_17723 [Haloferax mediterranei ATCC 33500]MDX5990076.1 hypothetical protein [Haloferax mediterranei ATCC 33500]QCQ76838.1 hypothetical protein E6P09_16040 [Haloferax mediterranei ATCC 33500]
MRYENKQLTAKQQTILYKKRDNPGWSNTRIANAVGCSDSHVSETLRNYDPEKLNDDGTIPVPVEPDKESAGGRLKWVIISLCAQGWGLLYAFGGPSTEAVTADQALLVFGIAWLIAPVVIFADAQLQHKEYASYRPNRIVWPTIAFCVPTLGTLYYVVKRA